MTSPGTVAVVLVDGPSAGLVIETAPTCTTWCQSDPMTPFVYDPAATATTWMPKYTAYCIRPTWWRLPTSSDPGWVEVGIRVGSSSPEGLQETAVRRHVRAALLEHPDLIPPGARVWPSDPADDEPIRIVAVGFGPVPICTDEIQMDPTTREVRGVCPCGWGTEFVPSRRFEELQMLTAAHIDAAVDWTIRQNIASGMRRIEEFRQSLGIAEAPVEHSHGGGAAEAAPTLYWGEPLTESDANWPAQGSTCAHICGADPDHTCSADGSMRLAYDLPSGGRRLMPICAPCHASETAAKETADACWAADARARS